MRRILLRTGLAIALLAPMASAANAVVISNTYTFTASRFADFSPHTGQTPPFDPVSGSFTLTLDTALGDQSDQTVGLVMHYLTMPVKDGFPADDNPLFAWNYRSLFDSVSVGGAYGGVAGLTKGAYPNNDFYLSINNMSASPTFAVFQYVSEAENAFFQAGELSMTITSAAPEPGAWALMLTGFGMAGSIFRRRRATAA